DVAPLAGGRCAVHTRVEVRVALASSRALPSPRPLSWLVSDHPGQSNSGRTITARPRNPGNPECFRRGGLLVRPSHFPALMRTKQQDQRSARRAPKLWLGAVILALSFAHLVAPMAVAPAHANTFMFQNATTFDPPNY